MAAVVGHRGVPLSGGHVQRLALATGAELVLQAGRVVAMGPWSELEPDGGNLAG